MPDKKIYYLYELFPQKYPNKIQVLRLKKAGVAINLN
jgi:hypothetical protein